jgi:hypothetical protein
VSRRTLLWISGVAMVVLLAVLVSLDGRMRAAGGPGIVGFELAGSLARSRDIVESWGVPGVRAARLSLVLDYPYLISYGAFLALAAAAIRDLTRRQGRRRLAAAGRVIVFFPVVAAGCDAIENVGLLLALDGRGGAAAPALAAGFAGVKFVLTTLAILYILIGLTARVRGPANPSAPS